MVLCFVALVVFAVLGVFSAKYRPLAREAFDCTFRKLTLRACETGLENRLKAKAVMASFRLSPGLARAVNKNFAVLSFAFTALFFGSLAYAGLGIYNFVAFGNCEGPDSTGVCFYQTIFGNRSEELNAPALSALDGRASLGPVDARVQLIEFGSFACDNTKRARGTVADVVRNYGDRVRLVWVNAGVFPEERRAAEAAYCALEQGKFWEYHEKLFGLNSLKDKTDADFGVLARQAGMNDAAFASCLASGRYAALVEADNRLAAESGVYGTPTFFVNGEPLVGAHSYDGFRKAVDAALAERT